MNTVLCLQVFLQPVGEQRGGQSQVPLQAVGWTGSNRCPSVQPHSPPEPPGLDTQHHHRQVQPPVFPAERDPVRPAWPRGPAEAAVLLRGLLRRWKLTGNVTFEQRFLPSRLLPSSRRHQLQSLASDGQK